MDAALQYQTNRRRGIANDDVSGEYAGLQQPRARRSGRRARMHGHAAEQREHVNLYRAFGEIEIARDFLVRLALHEKPEDIELAPRQFGHRCALRIPVARTVARFFGDRLKLRQRR